MYRHIRISCNIAKNKQPVPVQPAEIPIPIQTIIQTDIQILQLQMQQMQMQQMQMQLTQNNIILPVHQLIQPIQQLVQQPVLQQPVIQTQNIENQQNIETQNNINVNIVQYNLPYNNTEDVLKTILTKGSAFNNYALVDEKDDLSIEDENDYLAKIIIEVQLEINTKSENCNVKSDKSQKGYTKVLTITDNIKK